METHRTPRIVPQTTWATWAIASLGALATLVLMISMDDGRWFLGLALFAIWALGPYLLVAAIGYFARFSRVQSWGVLVLAIVITVSALIVYYDAFCVHTDPQSGLAFVSVPFLQSAGALVGWSCHFFPAP